jgi:hypothetical protein
MCTPEAAVVVDLLLMSAWLVGHIEEKESPPIAIASCRVIWKNGASNFE